MSFFFFKQKTAYEMRISDWSSDVCSSDVRNAMKAFLTLFTLGITASGTAQTQRFEDINGLEAMVVAKFGAAIGQPGGPAAPIDRRLKLAACPDTPSVEGPVMGAAVIRCAPVGWRIQIGRAHV